MTGGTPAPREGGAAFPGQRADEVTAGETGAAAPLRHEAAFTRRGTHEVTFTQQGMWVTEQAVKVGTAYHMPLLVHLRGALDTGALLAACAAVVDRHPMLRGVVAEVDDELRLVPGAEIPVRRATGSPGGSTGGSPAGSPSGSPTGSSDGFPAGSPDGEGAAGVDAAVREEILREFDLEHGPLARFTLFETGPGRHLLVFVAHHLIFDGQSKDILVRDLAAFYNGERPSPLPEIDHGRSERDRVAAMLPAAKEFWAPRWRDPGETVLLGRALRSRRAGEGRVLRLTADPSVPGLTRFEVLLAALHVLLSGYGNAEVTTAVDLSTRPAEAADHIGLFVNELPVSSTPSPEATFREFATGLRAELRQVYRFRQVPLTRAMPRIRPHAALVPVSVSYRTRHEADPVFTGLDASVEWTVFNHAVRGALHLQCVDGPGGLTVSLRHDPEAVPEAPRVANDLRLLLERATHDPDLPLKEILNQILE
ncbi:Condensation domain-containing protein [Streptosporangium canum]|uniref:Condensation domain-containing protein n=1 Tax=Streptosporangium canum TaxID=324952 RepID=A0A1I4F4C1_9ACTN|nr:condensation domain-containing protein [Streptosporangium canum]SFL12832.1 Condensation domain-containing protein [Streptosporangium canum]